MSVAGLDDDGSGQSGIGGVKVRRSDSGVGVERRENEALMILGVEGEVDRAVEDDLRGEKGILDVSVIRL